jgi:hypothetical protein
MKNDQTYTGDLSNKAFGLSEGHFELSEFLRDER